MENKEKFKNVAAAIQLISDNFRIFVSEVVGLNNVQFHNDLDDYLSNKTYNKLSIALPRGHGKSTHLSVAYPLWEIAKNHDVRILLVSSTAQIAQSFMSEITGHIEGNNKYQLWAKAIDSSGKGVVPRLRKNRKQQQKWTNDSIVIDRDNLQLKDPTINAVGLFGSILSKRADIIIVDDLVNQENSMTEDQRQKIKDWVYTTLMPVLVPGGKFIYLGNTWHMDDLMSNLLKDPQFDVRKKMPAIMHEATRQDLWDEWSNIHLDETLSPEDKKKEAAAYYAKNKAEMESGVEVLWPERFPYKDLVLLRIANPYSFARMYQCDPTIRPNQKFKESEIEEALRKGKDLVLQDAERTEYETENTTSGLDLAISLDAQSDDTVLLSIDRVKYGSGDIKAGDYVIRNIERGKMRPKDVRDMVARHDAIVKPGGIRVESVAYQESMSRDLEDAGIPITSYHTGKEKNDPDIGVNSLSIILAQGKVVLPYSNRDTRTRKLITLLINEMRAYPDGHTGDSLMALWFAYSEMRDYTRNKFSFPRPDEPKPKRSQEEEEREADQEIIIRQEMAVGDPRIARIKAELLKAQKADREYWQREALDDFRKKMGGY